jgi:hypothetical protein
VFDWGGTIARTVGIDDVWWRLLLVTFRRLVAVLRAHPVDDRVEVIVACIPLQLTGRSPARIGLGEGVADAPLKRLGIGLVAIGGDV